MIGNRRLYRDLAARHLGRSSLSRLITLPRHQPVGISASLVRPATSPDSSCGGLHWGDRGVGHELMSRDYGRLDSPVSSQCDLHPSGGARPSRRGVVDVACCCGCV